MSLLSLVIPTTGKPQNLFRCINSVTQNASESLLKKTELLVFINPDPLFPPNIPSIRQYLDQLTHLFAATQLVISEKYEKTAEESAYVAVATATGDYLWVSGDKRIYLPEGLDALDRWLDAPTTPCVYLNSIWIDSNAHTEGIPAVHFIQNNAAIPYKQFVMQAGVNFISTSMGAWVYERKYLDRSIWQAIIKDCGPHFSHVTTLLATLGDLPVTCLSSYFFLLESKAYHKGDDSEWAHYAKISSTYRFYAWTLGLVRQFNYLIKNATFSHHDIRRWMCSEGNLLRRQTDEIYNHLLHQLRLGLASEPERLKQDEFEEIMNFLERSCPERSILNRMLHETYAAYAMPDRKEFKSLASRVWVASGLDGCELRFSTLLVEQVGDKYVRLHPRGYIISRVTDTSEFLLAYKLFDAPRKTDHWQILSGIEYRELKHTQQPISIDGLFPVKNLPVSLDSISLKRRIVTALYSRSNIYWLFSKLPLRLQARLKRFFR